MSFRSVTAASLVAASLLARPAAAQPGCGFGSLVDYLAPGFACTFGPWRVANFAYSGAALAPEAAVPTPIEIALYPFAAPDAEGRNTFGFQFTGLAAGLHPEGAPGGASGALAANRLSFTVDAIGDGPRLLGTVVDAGAGVSGDAVAAQFLSGAAGAVIVGANGEDCGAAEAFHARTIGSTVVHAEPACAGGPVSGVQVRISTRGTFDRSGGPPLAFEGHAGGRFDAIAFVVAPRVVATPEPATAALLAGGLLALGALGRRRRA